MVDQLRLLWNRPLADGDRRRLFTLAAAIIAAAAFIVALAAHPAGKPTRESSRTRPATAPLLTFSGAPAPIATATPAAPSEEGLPSGSGSRRDVVSSRRVARAFLAGYLPYTYGRRSAQRITHASSALRRELLADRPRVPAAERRLQPRLELLQSDGVSHELARLHALVDDGRRRYLVALELARTPQGWIVTRAGG